MGCQWVGPQSSAESLWTVPLGAVVFGSLLKPQAAGRGPKGESTGLCPCLAKLSLGLSFPTCRGLCVLAEIVPEHTGGCEVQIHEMLVPPDPCPREDGRSGGVAMMLVISPATYASDPQLLQLMRPPPQAPPHLLVQNQTTSLDPVLVLSHPGKPLRTLEEILSTPGGLWGAGARLPITETSLRGMQTYRPLEG